MWWPTTMSRFPQAAYYLTCCLLLLLLQVVTGQGGGNSRGRRAQTASTQSPANTKDASTQTTRQTFAAVMGPDYDVNEWPGDEFDNHTEVSVQMFINSFGSLNAANMDYSIDVFLRQRWNDHRFAAGWARNPRLAKREKFTITDPGMQAKIWKPDTYFNNVKDAKVHQVTMPNILIRVHKNGDVLYSMRVTLTLTCSMEFAHYPFDAQSCGTSISSYANTEDVIRYKWFGNEGDGIEMPDSMEIAQFDYVNRSTNVYTEIFNTGNFSGLEVNFDLRRQNGYHVLQTYVPTILIVSISWVSFWLDPNAVPGRVSLGVTTLLTLTTLASGIRAQLPPVSYVKAIDVWIGMCMIMVFGALLEFTFANWLANKKIRRSRGVPFSIPACLSGSDAEEDPVDGPPKPQTTYMLYARCLDRMCRALFPGAFLLFNLIYWPYYLYKQTHAHERTHFQA